MINPGVVAAMVTLVVQCVALHHNGHHVHLLHVLLSQHRDWFFYIWVSVHHKSIIYSKPTRCNSHMNSYSSKHSTTMEISSTNSPPLNTTHYSIWRNELSATYHTATDQYLTHAPDQSHFGHGIVQC